jgi:hypothetical protein
MIDLKAVELSDKSWIDDLARAENSRSADFSFGNIYMWDPMFKQQISRVNDRLVVKLSYLAAPFFAFPIGSGELRPVIDAMRDYADTKEFRLRIRGVTAEHKAALEELYPDCFVYLEDRDYFDYIYRAEKLATYSGKKLHSKKNHVNRFQDLYPNWSFAELSDEHIATCIEMLEDWTSASGEHADPTLGYEHEAIQRGFDNYKALDMDGGVLLLEDKVIGFTMGEKISDDTYNVHFEKAYADIQGAYPMLSREFVKYAMAKHEGIVYINREDDMGKENIRKSKLSYRPEFFVEKWFAAWKD